MNDGSTIDMDHSSGIHQSDIVGTATSFEQLEVGNGQRSNGL